MAVQGIQIGQVLVRQGVLTDAQVKHILRVQRSVHRPFGDLAERLFGVSARAVEDAWVTQYSQITGVVDLESLRIDEACLRELNRRQAWQFHVLPLSRDEEHLQIATTPDNLVRALNFASRKLNEPIYLVIAERKQLREFLMKHYPVPQHIADFAEQM